MPRIARVVAAGLPHHITQRGNYRQDVFLDSDDRIQYIAWIKEYSLKYGLKILAYCLMQNHVHFIAIPLKDDSLAKTFNSSHMRYSQYFNRKLKQRGHLWQGRFYSCILDEPHLIVAARYVERNPVRAGLVEKPWQWPWSSAAFHTGQKETNDVELGDLLSIVGMSYDSWRRYLDEIDKINFIQDIRKYTFTGRPLGRAAFIKKMEEKFGKRLDALPIGRPNRD
jgi:putative transposase